MRQIKYEQKEMVNEIDGGHDEVMVIELNAQCAVMDRITRRFMLTFPKTWDKFVNQCIDNNFDVGGVSMFSEDGVIIAILNNVYFRVGTTKDSRETTRQMTLESLKAMIKITGKDKKFVSGYIGDDIDKRIWSSVVEYVTAEKLNWHVYRD